MTIASLGLGLIGEIWARHLRSDGFTVQAWNRTPKDFPDSFPSPASAVRGADLIIVCVSDPLAVQSVIEAIVPHLCPGQIVIQTSTVSAEWNLRYAAAVTATGARFLEAPFTGSKPAAEKRQTIFYIGGETDLLEKARPVLEKICQRILHIGPLGTAATLKLAMNLNLAGMMQLLGESLTLARAHGISDEVYFTALSMNAGRSGLSDLKQPGLCAQDYRPMFALKHMDKDLRLALETAGELRMEMTRQTKRLYEEGLRQPGWAEEDFSGLVRLISSEAKD